LKYYTSLKVDPLVLF